MKKGIFIFFILIALYGCDEKDQQPILTSIHISRVLEKMTDVMINDVTNPPLASRFFSYTTLAGYEVVSQNDSTCKSMFGILNGYPQIKRPENIDGYSYQLSAMLAMLKTAARLQPSGDLITQYEQLFLDSCKKIYTSRQIESSVKYAQAISKEILAYAKADAYNRISNYPRYSPLLTEGSWYPTPPGYFAPVEPYFNTVRPFTLDTCIQFKPSPPIKFSTDKGSQFYKLMADCYKESTNSPSDHQQIAMFWDCNPFALETDGHLQSGTKKISPGAHWIGITGIACKKQQISFSQAMKIHAVVSITLMDGFIACWDEKFRSNRIRPETAIRKYIDPEWKPLLQTPPFPEYLSGHSTISSAAAVVLTHYFGENFAYRDTVEERFDLPARDFTSFQQAAEEAGISRFYGGIHFIDAIDNGRTQGMKVGEWVLMKVEDSVPPKDDLSRN